MKLNARVTARYSPESAGRKPHIVIKMYDDSGKMLASFHEAVPQAVFDQIRAAENGQEAFSLAEAG